MARPGRLPRFRLYRRLLLILLVVIGGGLLVLYRMGKNARPDLGSVGAVSESSEEEVASAQRGEGFDQTVSEEGRPRMRIRGTRDRRDQEGNLHVEEVQMTVFEESGDLEVAAEEGVYNLDRRSAVLRGSVHVAGPDGLVLDTEKLSLKNNGRVVDSEGPVELEYGIANPLRGRARRFRATLDDDVFTLVGDVRVESRPEAEVTFSLSSYRLFFERRERLVRADGEVDLRWGGYWLRAERLAAHLEPDRDRLHFVQARWDVRAGTDGWSPEGLVRKTRMVGSTLALLMDARGLDPEKLELEGRRAALAQTTEDGTYDQLAARFFEISFRRGRLDTAVAVGEVELTEGLTASKSVLIQRLCGDRGTAVFTPAGELVRLELTDSVQLHRPGEQVIADHAVLDLSSGKREATGNPAWILASSGELRAPRVEMSEDTGLLHATEGVRALIPEQAQRQMGGTPLGGDEPLQVESKEAFWRQAPPSFLFRGDVRAWSGERLLLADQLRGDLADDRASAAGGVETLWYVESKEPGGAPRQIRVKAGTMEYDAAQDTILYREDVQAIQQEQVLRCKEMEVRLVDGDPRHMSCRQQVSLRDQRTGRTVKADRAEYDLAAGVTTFFGDPVELTDREGGRLHGRQLIYRLEDGRVHILSEAPEAGEGR